MRAVIQTLFCRFLGIDARLAEIATDIKRLITMSETEQQAVDHVAAAVASLKAETASGLSAILAKVTDLNQQIADLKAAGGSDPAKVASLEASATEIEADVAALHAGLDPTPTPAPAAA